jgi:hypothetical protein
LTHYNYLLKALPSGAAQTAAMEAQQLAASMGGDATIQKEAAEAIDKLRQALDAVTLTTPLASLSPERWAEAKTTWQNAIDSVSNQMMVLQRSLRGSGDEELEEIAEFGLSAVTNGHKVPLQAAIMEIGVGTPETFGKIGPKALQVVQSFQKYIETDERVAAIDENPDGIPVNIRAELLPALAALEAALTPA